MGGLRKFTSPPLLSTGDTLVCSHAEVSTWELGLRTQVLMLVWQILYQLNRIVIPYFLSTSLKA